MSLVSRINDLAYRAGQEVAKKASRAIDEVITGRWTLDEYTRMNNALRLGAFSWGANNPEDGVISFDAVNGHRAYHSSAWLKLGVKVDAISFDSATGNFTLQQNRGLSDVSVSLDGRYSLLGHTHDDRYYTETEVSNFFSGATAKTGYNKGNWDAAYGWGNHAGLYALAAHNHSGVYEPVFSKNTAFNKNFGTTAGTVAQGNDSRILNGQTAYSWGNHASAGYLLSSTAASTYVPLTRTVAGKALTSNITLASSDLTDVSNLAKLDVDQTVTGYKTILNQLYVDYGGGSASTTYATTLANATAHFGRAGSGTAVLFGVESYDRGWVQVQGSDSAIRNLLLNPIGGNVGVGITSNPHEKLHVSGNILASGDVNTTGLYKKDGNTIYTSLLTYGSTGSSGQVLMSNGATSSPVWATFTASAGGSSGQIQYNNGGVLGGFGTVGTYSISLGKPLGLENRALHPSASWQGTITYDYTEDRAYIRRYGTYDVPIDNNYTQSLTPSSNVYLDWRKGAHGDMAGLGQNVTLHITDVPDGAGGTVLVLQDGSSSTLTPTHATLTVITIGSVTSISPTANKYSLVKYRRYGNKLIIRYERQQ